MAARSMHHARWADVGNRRGWIASERGNLAAMRDGCDFIATVMIDKATRDFAAADELRAPGWLSVEDAEREIGVRR